MLWICLICAPILAAWCVGNLIDAIRSPDAEEAREKRAMACGSAAGLVVFLILTMLHTGG